MAEPAVVRVALIGNPNTGKTTLFNRLCGANAKTSNFPGTTADMRVGRGRLPGAQHLEIVDLPGVYGLSGESGEARIAGDILQGRAGQREADATVVVADAANLSRNLVLVGKVLARTPRVVVALNMVDLARRRGVTIDVSALARLLGAPVLPMVASKGEGLAPLTEAIAEAGSRPATFARPEGLPDAAAPPEAFMNWADGIAAAVTSTPAGAGANVDAFTRRLDRIVTHPVLGVLVFLIVIGGMFWSLFALATVPMDLIETTFAQLGGLVQRFLPDGPIRALLTDGIVGGIAGTVVFLPQICLLFFLISLLEDTGYLARAAFVNDRLFRRFGLPGQAFVPLLTSHACALPGIMSTRLIPNRRDRLTTILVAPFMSCSARLPVYVLLTSLLFRDRPGLAGVAFAGCFVLGAAAAFLTALLLGRTALKGRPRPMVLELPMYRVPSIGNALVTARQQGLGFLKTAGTVIMAICIVMWWLSAYPRVSPPAEVQALRAEAAQTGSPEVARGLTARADAMQAQAEQAGSFAGRMGRVIQPVFAPLGYDWQLTVGILTSFLAREVFVSTMSVLAGGGGDEGVVVHIRGMTRGDGTPVFTRATSASALVFFVLAMQCLPTLAVTRRETGSIKYAAMQLGYMSGLAYAAALIVYQGLRLAGVS